MECFSFGKRKVSLPKAVVSAVVEIVHVRMQFDLVTRRCASKLSSFFKVSSAEGAKVSASRHTCGPANDVAEKERMVISPQVSAPHPCGDAC